MLTCSSCCIQFTVIHKSSWYSKTSCIHIMLGYCSNLNINWILLKTVKQYCFSNKCANYWPMHLAKLVFRTIFHFSEIVSQRQWFGRVVMLIDPFRCCFLNASFRMKDIQLHTNMNFSIWIECVWKRDFRWLESSFLLSLWGCYIIENKIIYYYTIYINGLSENKN